MLPRTRLLALAGLLVALTLPSPLGEVAKPAIAPMLCSPFFGEPKTVEIHDGFFAPDPVDIVEGQVVHWVNVGQDAHTTTSTAVPPQWDSGVLLPGGTFDHRFCRAGEFAYKCTLHNFFGLVRVAEPLTP